MTISDTIKRHKAEFIVGGVVALSLGIGALKLNNGGERYIIPCQDKNSIARGWRKADISMDEALYSFDIDKLNDRNGRDPKHKFIGSYNIFGKSDTERKNAMHKKYELEVEVEGESRDDDITDTLISAKLCK